MIDFEKYAKMSNPPPKKSKLDLSFCLKANQPPPAFSEAFGFPLNKGLVTKTLISDWGTLRVG